MAIPGLFNKLKSALWQTNVYLNRTSVNSHLLFATRPPADGIDKKGIQIPEKPKKPTTPFFKFLFEHRPKVITSNPSLKLTEATKKCAEDWNKLQESEKSKFVKIYKDELEEYSKKIVDYTKGLSDDQISAIKELKQRKRSDREKKRIKKKIKEAARPKRPMSAFTHFVTSKAKTSSDKPKDLFGELATQWKNLPEPEKAKYHDMYLQDKKRYETEIEAWEKKMIAEGKLELIRSSVPKSKLEKNRSSKSAARTVKTKVRSAKKAVKASLKNKSKPE